MKRAESLEAPARFSKLHGLPVKVTTTGTVRPMTPQAEFALLRTALYSIGTVPVQLALGLLLAYLLFSEVNWGKSLYRVIYFMPYIAPSVATATVCSSSPPM